MSIIKCAVIGVGHLGRIHARLIRELDGVELVGVADPDREAREQVAQQYHVSHFADYQELIDSIDAAIIATPTRSHFEIAKVLLAHGVHVFLEKPMTHTSAQARHLVSLADSTNRVLQIGHVERFNPAFEHVRQTIRNPKYIEGSRTSNYTFRSTDIGVVHDLMIHDIDLVLSLNRSPITDVRALGISVFGGEEDIAHARLEFANGCVANLSASRTSFVANRSMHIFSQQGFFGLDFASGAVKTVLPSDEVRQGQHGFERMSLAEKQQAREEIFSRYLPLQEFVTEKQNAILQEQYDFVKCIQTGATPRVSAQDGCDAVELCDLILQQIVTHRWDGEATSRTNHSLTMPATDLSVVHPEIDQDRKAA